MSGFTIRGRRMLRGLAQSWAQKTLSRLPACLSGPEDDRPEYRALQSSISCTGIAIAVAIGAAFPLGFAVLEISSHRHHAIEHASEIADRISSAADLKNAGWPLSAQELQTVAIPPGMETGEYNVRISDADGRTLLSAGHGRWLHSKASAPIVIDGAEVASAEVGVTLDPSLVRFASVALVSAVFACFSLWFFRSIPLRILANTASALERRERELSRHRDELKTQVMINEVALAHMEIGLSMFDADDRLIVCNPKFLELFHLPSERIERGLSFHRIIEIGKEVGNHPGRTVEEVYEARRAQIAERRRVSTVHHVTGDRIVAVTHVPLADGGWLATHEDITERCENDARIAYLANHDPLTALPNRRMFRELLGKSLEALKAGDHVAVHCIDLDRFKEVNDTLGHPIGDRLLTSCAERLREAVGPGHFLARLGGDEFAIVQPSVADPNDASALAERIVESFSLPFSVEGHDLLIGTSVGIALSPADGISADELIKNADLAMYRAKADGRGNWRLFERGMDARLHARRALENDLRKAISLQQLEIYYQPVFSLKRAEVTGFEALLRWNHPRRGMISPAEFIPVAEETGLIVPIGDWVLRRACETASLWPAHIKVAVNLSPVQFRNQGLVHGIVSALAASRLDPERLELEITESVLLNDSEANLLALHHLRGLGIRIALDDFGTGYSSLSYLRSFPFDKLKIDRSFVRGLSMGDESALIVRSIADLGHNLGMITTAEGIETLSQLELLHQMGCCEVQGYLISPPRPESHVAGLIHAFQPGPRAAAAA
jgi:diguanylate cyclase (GGDEF)-like protein